MHMYIPERRPLNSAADAQTPNLLQNRLDLGVQLTLGVLLAGVGVQVLLDLGHAGVSLGAEAELDLDEGLEARVQVRDAEVDELGELREELVIELLIGGLGHLGLLLGAGELGHVLVGLLNELLDLGAHGVVVKELVVALLDAYTCVSFDLGLTVSYVHSLISGK